MGIYDLRPGLQSSTARVDIRFTRVPRKVRFLAGLEVR